MEGTKLDKMVVVDKAESKLVINWLQVFERLLCVFDTGQKRPFKINSNLKFKKQFLLQQGRNLAACTTLNIN